MPYESSVVNIGARNIIEIEIDDSEDSPHVEFNPSNVDVVEGNSGSMTIRRYAGDDTVAVKLFLSVHLGNGVNDGE